MGLTLIEAAKYENRLEHLAVLKTFSEGELLAQLPFMNIAGSGLFYSAEQELPSVGFRAVNEGYTQSYGVVDQRAEAVHQEQCCHSHCCYCLRCRLPSHRLAADAY